MGKTVALLAEGRRRADRGTDVVVAVVDPRGRPGTEARLAGLPMVAPRPPRAGAAVAQIDVPAVVARRPAVALVDDLGASWAGPDGPRHRWQDAEDLLAAGIDVVATVDVTAIASLAAQVEQVTGSRPVAAVPDAFLAGAAQLEFLDIDPAAFRRRLAHGNIISAEALDTSTARTFEEPTLAALRLLALDWLTRQLRTQGAPEGPAGDDGPSPGAAGGPGGRRPARITTAPGSAWRMASGLPARRRQLVAIGLALLLLPLVTGAMEVARDQYSLTVALLAYVVVVVGVTSVGGALVGFGCAVAAFLCATWFFTQPVHSFTVSDSDDLVALAVFLAVAAIVSILVHIERLRAAEARLSGEEAAAVAAAAVVLARAPEPVDALVGHLSRALGGRPVTLGTVGAALDRELGVAGPITTLDVDEDHRLHIGGGPLAAPLHRLAVAVASQLATALEARALRLTTEEARQRAAGDAYRTALLQAVSHDLRTPLTSIKTSVSSLLSHEVAWSPEETGEFLEVIDAETDRLDRLIANLLDMSRLQAGGIHVHLIPVDPEDCVTAALTSLSHLPPDRCRLVVDHPDLLIEADPALLERVLANLVANAERAAPAGTTVTIRVGALDERWAAIRVIDTGPGIPARLRARAVHPFQRLGDRDPGSGIGLGLAIADGFVVAMGGRLTLDDTPGGGLTATIRIARTDQENPRPWPPPS